MSVRFNLTNDEKLAQQLVGLEKEGIRMNMQDNESIEETIEREKKESFNDQVDKYIDKFDRHSEVLKQYAESFNENMNGIEIKAMFARVLVQPFKQNPFQKIKIDSKSGIILDTGGMVNEYKNTDTGEWEEEQQFIITGAVIDCGPDVKYLQAGDVVFYRVDTAVPVPFFKQGLYSISENQIIAAVNSRLTERFNEIGTKDSEWIDISCIPECLGDSYQERINKWLELRKQGVKFLQKDA